VLPSGFSKIRYFGFLALRHLQANIEQCIELLDKVTLLPELVGLNAYEIYRQLFEKDPPNANTENSIQYQPNNPFLLDIKTIERSFTSLLKIKRKLRKW
jgi:hypothetical protein